MRRPELDNVLNTMLASQAEVSDLLFTVDKPLQVESFGELMPVTFDPPIEKLTPFQTEMIALNMIGENQWHLEDLLRRGSCDAAYTLTDKARFRINIFSQRGNYSIVCRKLNTEIPTLEWLQFPEIIRLIPREKTGLVLVTGATGSGKSTTLAAVLNEINHTKPIHVITLEDPVEFVHPHHMATFNQRELGTDFDSYSNGLRAALRQAPKVILVGEMRDRETVKIALSAAETGHLVLSTLHTNDAPSAITRLTEMGIEPFLVGSALDCVLAQRLARRLCVKCKAAYVPDPRELEAAAFPWVDGEDLPELFRPVGCAACAKTGYKGRLALHEVMGVSEEIERLAVTRASGTEIGKVARAEGMHTLRTDGMYKVAKGVTSLEEILRVVA
jgi:pilus retraction protein PilT